MTIGKNFLVHTDTALSVKFMFTLNKSVLAAGVKFRAQGCQDCQLVYPYGLVGNCPLHWPLVSI